MPITVQKTPETKEMEERDWIMSGMDGMVAGPERLRSGPESARQVQPRLPIDGSSVERVRQARRAAFVWTGSCRQFKFNVTPLEAPAGDHFDLVFDEPPEE